MGINTADTSGSNTGVEQNPKPAENAGITDRDTIGINTDSSLNGEVIGINNTKININTMGTNANIADTSGTAIPKSTDTDIKKSSTGITSETHCAELDVKPKLVSHHKKRPKSR